MVVLLLVCAGQAMAYYNPSTGRFLSRDPRGELGFQVMQRASGGANPGRMLNRQTAAGMLARQSQGRIFQRSKAGLPGKDPNAYLFVQNNPIVLVDFLGLTTITSTEAFCGATRNADGAYVLEVDDDWDGTVELQRITMAEIETEKKRLVTYLQGYEKADGCKSRKYEGGFDSRYFEGENQQLQYYLVDGQCPIYAGNEINYIGIGLYEAWLCHSLTKAKATVWLWKTIRWRDIPSEGTMHWLEVGYNNYATLKGADDTCCRCGGDTASDGGGGRR